MLGLEEYLFIMRECLNQDNKGKRKVIRLLSAAEESQISYFFIVLLPVRSLRQSPKYRNRVYDWDFIGKPYSLFNNKLRHLTKKKGRRSNSYSCKRMINAWNQWIWIFASFKFLCQNRISVLISKHLPANPISVFVGLQTFDTIINLLCLLLDFGLSFAI